MPKESDFNQHLLPWYVNGTLSEIEIARINRWQKTDSQVEFAVKQEIELAKLFYPDSTELDRILQQRSTAFSQLQQKICANTSDTNIVQKKLMNHSNWFRVATAIAASFLLIFCLSWIPNASLTDKKAEFQVLTSPHTGSGITMQIVFEAEASEQLIKQMLSTDGTHLLSGPSINNVYRVQLQHNVQVNDWQQHPLVQWAEVEIH